MPATGSGRPGDDARVVQTADFGLAQAEDVEENLIRVLAQSGRRCRRQARQAAEIERRRRHQVGTDAGLFSECEQRIVGRAIGVGGNFFAHATIRAPGDAVCIEGQRGFGQCTGVKPRFKQPGDLLAGTIAIVVMGRRIDFADVFFILSFSLSEH